MASTTPAYLLEDIALFITEPSGAVRKFSCDLTGYGFPESSTDSSQSEQSLCPSVGKFDLGSSTSSSNELSLDYFVDWARSESLAWFLNKNQSEKSLAFQLVDRAGTKAGGILFEGTIESLPGGGAGGQAGQTVKSEVTIKLVGRPTRTPVDPVAVITGLATDTAGGWMTPIGALYLADLTALKADAVVGDGGTAAPATDTPSGEFIWLADRSKAHYAGSAWVAGVAA